MQIPKVRGWALQAKSHGSTKNLLTARLVSLGYLCQGDTLTPQLIKSEGVAGPSLWYNTVGLLLEEMPAQL